MWFIGRQIQSRACMKDVAFNTLLLPIARSNTLQSSFHGMSGTSPTTVDSVGSMILEYSFPLYWRQGEHNGTLIVNVIVPSVLIVIMARIQMKVSVIMEPARDAWTVSVQLNTLKMNKVKKKFKWTWNWHPSPFFHHRNMAWQGIPKEGWKVPKGRWKNGRPQDAVDGKNYSWAHQIQRTQWPCRMVEESMARNEGQTEIRSNHYQIGLHRYFVFNKKKKLTNTLPLTRKLCTWRFLCNVIKSLWKKTNNSLDCHCGRRDLKGGYQHVGRVLPSSLWLHHGHHIHPFHVEVDRLLDGSESLCFLVN